MTPKGTRPGDRVTTSSSDTKSSKGGDWASDDSGGSDERDADKPRSKSTEGPRHAASSSSRYTPPIPEELKHSPPWVPYVMLILLGLGAVMIMVRYLAFDSNWPTLVGLVFILGGLYTATKWR